MQTEQCTQCNKTFKITDQDLEFYAKIDVSQPTHCPDCRQQRRLAWCNEGVLYSDECDRCGKKMISQFAPNNPRTVWCLNCWWKDDWAGQDYGRDIDWTKPFFEQLHELELAVPHACVASDEVSENSEYTHHAGQNKNCYLIFHATYNENCYYSYGIKKSKDCIDTHNCFNSELCYECVDVDHCYNLGWSQDCNHCSNSRFLRDCVGVSDSFLCVGLRNKQYCWLNEQLTPEAYQQKLRDINLGSYQVQQYYWKLFMELQQKHAWRYAQMTKVEDATGNYLTNAKAAYDCYDCNDVEQTKYCYQLQLGTKDAMDLYQFGIGAELIYEGTMIGTNVYNIRFSSLCIFGCSDLTYCIDCYNSTNNCFGCVGLKQTKFCILNKQYSEADYYVLCDRIVEHMKQGSEWGEFFPVQYSQSAYNETSAQLWFPLSKAEVLQRGWQWQDSLPNSTGKQTLVELPDTIADVADAIVKEILQCCHCRKNYKITAQELKFYQHYQYPLPRFCFSCRRVKRMQLRNPRKIWQRQCMCTQVDHAHNGRCATEFETTYSPDRIELVYCETCYQKEIY